MITLNNITMGFSSRTLFKDVTLSIFKNEKIGLAGPNGAGKSTLFSIILREMEPVSGSVQIQKNINIGHLPQEAKFNSDKTVMDEVASGDNRIKSLLEEKHKLEDNDKVMTDRYGDILHELELLGLYEIEHKAEKILAGLGFQEREFHKPIVQLSGGWQMRVLLAKLLTYQYDLILLDEPTNYLDLQATLWLKDFLKNYDGSFVLISHDRVFLSEVTNYTVLLEGSQMFKVKGNYDEFKAQKDVDNRSLEKRQKVIEKKQEQLERFTQRFHAQPNRASAVKNKLKMLEKLAEQREELPGETKSVGEFSFPPVKRPGYVVAGAYQVSKSYKDISVYKNLDFEVLRDQKVCLVGPNGAGKSTLLKMLAGVLTPDTGEIKYGTNVDVGYFSQTRLDVLNLEKNAFEEVVSVCPHGVPSVRVRSLLGLFNFHGDDVFKSVKILSGGEKSRLILAKLLIDPPNFMCLDEPTTHLDLDGIKALTVAFQKYEGTVCFISHDLFFIREVADCVVEVNHGQLRVFPGGLDYYLEKKSQSDEQMREDARQLREAQQKKQEQERKQKERQSGNSVVDEAHRKHMEAKKRLKEIKEEMGRLEEEKKNLEVESYVKGRKMSELFNSPEVKDFGRRLKEIQSRLREIEMSYNGLITERDKINQT
ncbi:MAG: ATP-binding cassette domain-containing protein [Candidatus Omnitrophica bacterium]|nr:ATP-binding cassette domain-containing protein [Candidatus Omnitrophota bacterium]